MHLDHLLSRLFPVYECCEGLIPASIIHVFKLEGPNWGWLYQLELKPCESGERHMKNLKRSQPGLAVWCHLAASCWILVALAVLHYIYITSCFYWNLWLQKVCSSTFVLLWLLSAKCELWLFSGCLQRHTGKKLGFQFWWLPPTTQCSTLQVKVFIILRLMIVVSIFGQWERRTNHYTDNLFCVWSLNRDFDTVTLFR